MSMAGWRRLSSPRLRRGLRPARSAASTSAVRGGRPSPRPGGKPAPPKVDAVLDEFLPNPSERTAINGFGFVQVVRGRPRASLIELARDRATFEARAVLRRAASEPAGSRRIVAHPAVIAVLEKHREWLDALGR